MRVLLDTHAIYWYIEGDPQLIATAQTLIQDASNEILISPASYWEIAIKLNLGKWNLNRPYEEFIDIGLNKYDFQVLPILPTHTARLIGLPNHHKDPFDRLLIAQSIVEGITLLTTDSLVARYPGPVRKI